ncbi:MAG: hypothetical protein H7Y15_17735, partial [Pseudonocardia sp.]|nr:hypothetical protein [Pseudonocardia sp.]
LARCSARRPGCTSDGERVLVDEQDRMIYRYLCPSCQLDVVTLDT